MVLPNNMFQKIALKIGSEEIKNANIEGMETCPFCDFAMVLPEEEKIFKCINEECLIESCRECRHESHIPKRCNEIEYDEDVRRRTFIENKMTEAFTRYVCMKSDDFLILKDLKVRMSYNSGKCNLLIKFQKILKVFF